MTAANKTIIKTHAKWVLAGEHAVMRGASAIALPLTQYELTIEYQHSDQPFNLNFYGEYGETLRVLVWGGIHEALAKLKLELSQLTGTVRFANTIPMGAGLGFSAALCVGIGRLLIHLGFLNEIELFDFAKHLEDLFHGNSSGMDIASVIYSKPILFNKNGHIEQLDMAWQPKLYLSYTNHHSLTIDCVNQVKQLMSNDPKLALQLDQAMQTAVDEMIVALQSEQKKGESLLVQALERASSCFASWGLINESMLQQIDNLKQAGALALKPTGAGNGGYLISLWKSTPDNLSVDVIPAL